MLTPRADDLWESRFGEEEPFALGIEEELLVVDEHNELLDRAGAAVRQVEPDEGGVDSELFHAMVETKSHVAAEAREAVETLYAIRSDLLDEGARIMAVGVHPSAEPGSAVVRSDGRYGVIKDMLQGLLRTPICGQHVHVGMPDEETAVRAYNGIRAHIPLINALAANSPFWFGEDSGLATSRTVIFRSYPRAAMAPEFADFRDFCSVTRQVCAAAGLEDYTHIWWDARIHPGLGTIEVRAADTQTELWRAEAIAALIHCLAFWESQRARDGLPAREALAESSFQATRHGLDAELIDRDCELVPARQLAHRRVDEVASVASDLGCECSLELVLRIVEEGPGANLQRRVHAESGLEGLLRWLTARSAELTGYSAREERPGQAASAAEGAS